jgi:putative ABC transport system ATP-binding protein
MSGPVLEAIDVGKILGSGAGRVEALRGVSLALAPGELALLMGPSGSGKTTLLSILGCMLSPSRGTVRLRGRAVGTAGPEALAKLRRDHLGFVFQTYHLFPTLNAVDNIRLALDVRGERGRKANARAKDALAQVGLAHKQRSYPRDLSSGEQQRVAIARAVVANPSIILADEPTAALDGDNGRGVMTILRTMARERGCAVLVVTHDPRLLPFSDRVIHIEDGRITGEDRTDAPSRHIAQIAQITGQLSAAAAARPPGEPRPQRAGGTS